MRLFVGAVLLLLVYGCQADTRLLQDQISARWRTDLRALLNSQLTIIPFPRHWPRDVRKPSEITRFANN
jgi:hypothetical protein